MLPKQPYTDTPASSRQDIHRSSSLRERAVVCDETRERANSELMMKLMKTAVDSSHRHQRVSTGLRAVESAEAIAVVAWSVVEGV